MSYKELFMHGYCNVYAKLMHQLTKDKIYYYIGLNEEFGQFLVHAVNKNSKRYYDANGAINDIDSYLETFEELEELDTEFYLITGDDIDAFESVVELPTLKDLFKNDKLI